MIPDSRIPTHPGEVLRQEFLVPLGLSQVELARRLEVPLQRMNEIIRGKRGITAETAWLLSGLLGTSPEFWTNLQAAYDLARSRPKRRVPRLVRTGASRAARQRRWASASR